MRRYTFVVQVHPEGVATLENLTTRERIQVHDLDRVGSQIEYWLRALGGADPPPADAQPTIVPPITD